MSWLARSIANSLNLDDTNQTNNKPEQQETTTSSSSSPRGVKQDLSELSTTLTTQFWGVASFLAPPANPPANPDPDTGIRTDLGQRFRTGISRISNNIHVSEFTKVASTLLQLQQSDHDDEEEGSVVSSGVLGVNDGVVEFAKDLALRPETWLNFPLPDDENDVYGVGLGFELSDAQQEHALAVERLAPELAALRIELCPGYMSESCFWMVYFLLIHPRLDKQDAQLLSTPQIEKARGLLAPEVNSQTTVKPEEDSKNENLVSVVTNISRHEELSSVPSPSLSVNERSKAPNFETGIKPAAEINEIQIDNRPVTEEKDADQLKCQTLKPGSVDFNVVTEDEDDADDWLKEEDEETNGTRATTVPIEDEEDVSFSDLEEDDDGDVPASYRKSNDSSDKNSKDWVRIK